MPLACNSGDRGIAHGMGSQSHVNEFLDYRTAIEDGIDKLNKYYSWFDLKPSIVLSLGKVFFYLYFSD